MTWTAPPTFVAGGILTAAQLNTIVGDLQYNLIASTVLGVATASITFSSIPSTFTHLELVLLGRCATAAESDAVLLQFNGDTAANYAHCLVRGNATAGVGVTATAQTSIGVAQIPGTTASASRPGSAKALIPCYAQTTLFKTLCSIDGFVDLATANNSMIEQRIASWHSTAAINSLKLTTAGASNFVIGTAAYLYGIV